MAARQVWALARCPLPLCALRAWQPFSPPRPSPSPPSFRGHIRLLRPSLAGREQVAAAATAPGLVKVGLYADVQKFEKEARRQNRLNGGRGSAQAQRPKMVAQSKPPCK